MNTPPLDNRAGAGHTAAPPANRHKRNHSLLFSSPLPLNQDDSPSFQPPPLKRGEGKLGNRLTPPAQSQSLKLEKAAIDAAIVSGALHPRVPLDDAMHAMPAKPPSPLMLDLRRASITEKPLPDEDQEMDASPR